MLLPALLASVLVAAPAPAAQPLECVYAARASSRDPTPDDREMKPRGVCADPTPSGELRFREDHLARLDYDASGLATVWLEGVGFAYVKRSGENAVVLTWDNGPDPFAEGLTRARRNGKVVYLDKDLHEVIGPVYDFGWPFEGGRALVCRGCRPVPPPEGDPDRHVPIEGGEWGYIDHLGREIVPVTHTREEIPRDPR